jgi:hypothetical protein
VLLARIPAGRPNQDLFELPSVDVPRNESSEGPLAEGLRREMGLRVEVGRSVGIIRHTITHRRIALEVFSARREGALPRGRGLRFVPTAELAVTPLASAARKALSLSGR